ncbi:hypothetical protein PCL1606_50400 [Pseudomonas chlororaphis]|uniref:Uncharacterized protein n=1 Tax=Pseudomonas chlororaphis TaxID=587753 RepID=A0A0D5Y599_9PSED|nr:hypothetical protein PCL1606_50400 [Pseudomonas chlororaphis]
MRLVGLIHARRDPIGIYSGKAGKYSGDEPMRVERADGERAKIARGVQVLLAARASSWTSQVPTGG